MHRHLVALVLAVAVLGRPARAGRFEDLGPSLGLYAGNPAAQTGKTLVAGVSLGDLDRDGDLDLVTTEPLRGLVIHLREGAKFRAAPEWVELPVNDVAGYGHTLFDMDGDGDLDLYYARDDLDRLYENVGDAFVEVTSTRLPGLPGWSSSATAADLDGDGDLDLLVARYIERVDFPNHLGHANLVLENDGAGRFRDITADVGLAGTRGCSFTIVAFDMDGDHDLDLLAVNDFSQFVGRTELWRNDPDGRAPRFTEVSAAMGLVAPVYGMGAAIADLDQNGRLEVFVTNIGEPLLFELDPEVGRFSEVGFARGMNVRFAADRHQVTWTARALDLDRDGYLDLLAASGALPAAEFIANPRAQQSVWLRGTASGALASAPASDGFTVPEGSMRDFEIADLTGDGRPEIIAVHIHGGISVLQDTTLAPPPTTLALTPTTTAPGAAGAFVQLACGGVVRTRHVTAGGDYGAADRGEVDFAFPPPCPASGAPLTGLVRWPSGYVQAIEVTSGVRTELVEDAWLEVEDGTLVVDLRAHLGEVEVVSASVTGGTAEEIAPREWRVSPPADLDGEVALGLVVDGRPWGVTVRLGRAAPRRWLVPPRPVVGRALAVLVPAEDVAEGARVRLGASEVPLLPIGGGMRRAFVTPDSTGPVELVIASGDGAHAEVIDVAGRISPERSELDVRDLHILASNRDISRVRLRLRLADPNGVPSDVPLEAFGVEADGVPIEPIERALEGRLPALVVPHELLAHGARLQVVYEGAPLFEAQTVLQLASAFDVGRYVSVERSWCALSEPRLRADGIDRGSVVLLLYDAQGARLPDFGLTPLFDPSGLSVPGGVIAAHGGWLVPVRAGAEVMVGALAARVSGMGSAVTCAVALARPPVLGSAVEGAPLVLLPEAPRLDEPLVIRYVPLGADGRGLGSGVGFRFEVAGAEIEPIVVRSAKTYVGFGRYDLTLTPRLGGPLEIQVIADDGRVLAVKVVAVEGVPVEPGPEPVEVVEASEPVAEPVESVELVEPGPEPLEEVGGGEPEEEVSEPVEGGEAEGVEEVTDLEVEIDAELDVAEPEPPDVETGSEVAEASEEIAEPDADRADLADEDVVAYDADASDGAEASPRRRDEGCRAGSSAEQGGAFVASMLVMLALLRRRASRRECWADPGRPGRVTRHHGPRGGAR